MTDSKASCLWFFLLFSLFFTAVSFILSDYRGQAHLYTEGLDYLQDMETLALNGIGRTSTPQPASLSLYADRGTYSNSTLLEEIRSLQTLIPLAGQVPLLIASHRTGTECLLDSLVSMGFAVDTMNLQLPPTDRMKFIVIDASGSVVYAWIPVPAHKGRTLLHSQVLKRFLDMPEQIQKPGKSRAEQT